MAEAVLSHVFQNLINLALQEANRFTDVKEPMESLEKELVLMNALIKSLEAMAELDQNAQKWMEEASIVARRAEDLVSHYEKSLAKRKGAAILKWPYLKERYELARELDRVTLEIHHFSEEGKQILTQRNLHLPFSSEEVGGNISDPALIKLNVFLSQHWFLPGELMERLKTIKDEMAPFDKFLREVEAEAELDERQKVWVQEIKDIFQLLEESLLSFERSREEEIKDLKCFSPILTLDIFWASVPKFNKKIMKIEERIAAVSSRHHLYAIGEFKLRGGLRSIVPQMRSHIKVEPVKSSLMTVRTQAIDLLGITAKLFSKIPSGFDSEQFTVDLKLMKALFEDASKMKDSDKRVKVWLEQMRAIYNRLQKHDAYAKEISEGRMGVRKILSLPKLARETMEIEKEIHDALLRKMRYDIGCFVAENGNAEAQSETEDDDSGQSTSSGKLQEQIRLMKELQLMDALLKDISTMEKLDTRLQAWLQEILGVAGEAKAIAEQDFRGISGRIKLARKMHRINKWIDEISEWKRTYDVRVIKATDGSARFTHDLVAAEVYPSGIVEAEFESLRRELKLMKALDHDMQEVVGIDGKLEVWMEEMRDVAKDAEKFIDEHADITRKRGKQYLSQFLILYQVFILENKHPYRILHIKDKIQKLHERRIRYGIEQINRIPANIDGETVSGLESILMPLTEEETSGPESSTVSHENAPSYLWRCLFYFLLFPAGMEIPARRLIALWVAEGLVCPKRGENKPTEYFCELYLSELIRRRMIRATKRKLNGKVKACQLCDNMQETLLKMAKEANFFQDESAMTFRLVVHYANRDTSYGHVDGSIPCSYSELKARYKKVISFFSFDTEEGGKHGENIGNFLNRCLSNRCFLSLRVLDLERVFKPKLPSALGILTGLRYLGLRWTYLECLPDLVSKLLNLLVLDVKRTYISTLPRSIWSMQYLRHLYLSETYQTRFVSRPRNKSLTDLQTLWGAFIDEDSPVLNGLDTILNVRKLGLTCRSMSSADEMKSQLDAVGDWILKLEHLEHLRLKSFDDLGNPSDLHLKPLSGHYNLSIIYLVGRLRYPSIVSEFPVNLTDLALSGSELKNDPMIALQSLQKLVILRLLSRSTTCRTMRCTRGGFPQLRVLKIWDLEHLKGWELEEGALTSLKDLEIRDCQNLKMVPYELTRLETLREFKLSDQFAEIIKDKQQDVWDKIKHLVKVDRE